VVIERSVRATTRGRYLVDVPATPEPWPVLVGFHGYAESADTELERLRSIAGADSWLRVSIQGLHRFYRGRNSDVVSSWMTRQDREQAIADNMGYIVAVLDAVSREWKTDGRVAFTGFSQGVAMAFRAAAAVKQTVTAVVALGGDVPPELGAAVLSKIPAVLIGRGARDTFYTTEMFDADVQRLGAAGVHVDAAALDAGHEWTDEFGRAAGTFLSRR
jgi:predicted esterase